MRKETENEIDEKRERGNRRWQGYKKRKKYNKSKDGKIDAIKLIKNENK